MNPKTGAQEPCYTFTVNFKEDESGMTDVADSNTEVTLDTLKKRILEDVDWWNVFICDFLKATSKFFTKSYTIDQINKITRHTLTGSTFEGPANIQFLPKTIQISGGIFTVNWGFVAEPFVIDIPDLEAGAHVIEVNSLPDSKKNEIIDGVEELNIDEIPAGSGSTDAPLELESPAKFYEKQRVKEARLKAKLAVYKAQRTMAQYYEKYGDDISDSDSEIDSSDEDSGEDSEQEEVQL